MGKDKEYNADYCSPLYRGSYIKNGCKPEPTTPRELTWEEIHNLTRALKIMSSDPVTVTPMPVITFTDEGAIECINKMAHDLLSEAEREQWYKTARLLERRKEEPLKQ